MNAADASSSSGGGAAAPDDLFLRLRPEEFFKNDIPAPALPHNVDEYKIPFYTHLPPEFKPGQTYLYRDLLKHIPYLYYSDPVKNKYGGITVYKNLYRGAARSMRVQLCAFDEEPLRAPFGMQIPESKDSREVVNTDRPALSLTIEGTLLHTFLEAMDQKNLQIAKARKDRLFPTFKSGRNMKNADVMNDMIETLYRPLVTPPSPPKDGEPRRPFKDTVRTKIALYGDNATRVYEKVGEDENGTVVLRETTAAALVKGVRVIPIVDFFGLWFVGGGKTWGDGIQVCDIIVIPQSVRVRADFQGAPVRVLPPSLPSPMPPSATGAPEGGGGGRGGVGGAGRLAAEAGGSSRAARGREDNDADEHADRDRDSSPDIGYGEDFDAMAGGDDV
jgi:hypothetical protein